MTLQIVQGFQGNKRYDLSVHDPAIDLSGSEIFFNYARRDRKTRYSIKCLNCESVHEVLIPFSIRTTSEYGKFYGEFVIRKLTGEVYIYPVLDYITLNIRRSI